MFDKILPYVTGLRLLRLAVAFNLLTHGLMRLRPGATAGFGGFLDSVGFSGGVVWAWCVTIYEVIGPPLMALGIWYRWIAAGHILILVCGIALVHFREGWFVVGHGRNGFEYSVLIIMALLAIITAKEK